MRAPSGVVALQGFAPERRPAAMGATLHGRRRPGRSTPWREGVAAAVMAIGLMLGTSSAEELICTCGDWTSCGCAALLVRPRGKASCVRGVFCEVPASWKTAAKGSLSSLRFLQGNSRSKQCAGLQSMSIYRGVRI
jgi:hypothetical protein